MHFMEVQYFSNQVELTDNPKKRHDSAKSGIAAARAVARSPTVLVVIGGGKRERRLFTERSLLAITGDVRASLFEKAPAWT